MNQAVSFGLLGAGGILLTKALTGSSFADVVKGHPGSVPDSGSSLTVAGVGTAAANIATGATGTATAAGAPASVATMLALAQSLVGAPYSQANHAGAFTQTAAQIKQLGTDCSGFVSVLLGHAGFLTGPQTTVTLPDQPGIAKGAGQYVTIWNNPLAGNAGHVFIDIAGQFFEAAGGGVGVQPISSAGAAQMIATGDNGAPYYPLHPVGL